jgi:hypothetical protein
VHAAAYQAGSNSMTHVALDGRDATPRAVAAALHGWRATVESHTQARAERASISRVNEVVFWVLGVAVAFASFALAFRLHRSKVRHSVAFR